MRPAGSAASVIERVVIALALACAFGPGPGVADVLERSAQRGPVEVLLRLEPAAPVIGDAIHLEIEALAEEGVELLMPEFGEALDRFLILDFAPSEGIAEDGRTRSLQRYTLQPPMSGPQSVPPLLVEFVDRRPGSRPAPEGSDAYELLTERLDFEVQSVLPEDALAELRPMPGTLAPLGSRAGPLWLWLLILAVLLAVAAPFAYRAWQRAQVERRKRTAHQIAVEALEALLAWGSHPKDDEIEKFYIELSGIIRRYLEDRFNLRSPELTTEEFLTVASRSPDLSPEMRSLLSGFLTRADLVKFAGFVPTPEQISESIESAGRFLQETRDSAEVAEVAALEGEAA
jgi:type II secretory pathway pseudopilin PulG